MTTLIIGASGQIGRILVDELIANGRRPRVLVRRAETGLDELDVDVVQGDLELGIADAVRGTEKVVFTAGSGGNTGADKTILVDLWGAMKAIDAAKEEGVEHFVMVSARGAHDPDRGSSAIKHYNICKKIADDYLIESGVPYTILRPGRLTNDPATHRISTRLHEEPAQQWIPRADVAGAIHHCLDHPETRGRSYFVVHGDEPIGEALR